MEKRNLKVTFSQKRRELALRKKAKKRSQLNGNPTDEQLVRLLNLYRNADFEQAERAAVSLTLKHPGHPFGWKVLGAILNQSGRISESLIANEKCVELSPLNADAHSNLGVTQRALGNLSAAESSLKKAILLNPACAAAYNNLGLIQRDRKEINSAEVSYIRAISLEPKYFDAYSNLGDLQTELGKLQEAVGTYKIAVSLQPESLKALNNLGCLLQIQGKLEEAEKYFKKAVSLKAAHLESLHNLGIIQTELEKFDNAETSFKKAIELSPEDANLYVLLGTVLTKLKKFANAESCFKHALILKHDLFEAHDNLVGLLKGLKNFDGLRAHCKSILRSNPDFVEAKVQLAWLDLTLENFSEGFEQFEVRHHKDRRNRATPLPKIKTPKYIGLNLAQDLLGRHLLILPEQGVGDEVMFASVISELKPLVKLNPATRITLACDSRLVSLFKRSFDFVNVIPKDPKNTYEARKDSVDFWIFSGSLPRFYRKSSRDFSLTRPFLQVDSKLNELWKSRYSKLKKSKNIGISWRGGLNEKAKAERSQSLSALLPILVKANQNANIINLQYGDHNDEIEGFCRGSGITIYDWKECDPLKDLDNFSAQIKALDLVVCIDNSTAHFAGALGVKTYLMLPFDQDWRWGETRDNSYWYPNIMTLFRQPQRGAWDEVVKNVANTI